MSRYLRLILPLVGLLLVLGACGNNGEAEDEGDAPDAPVATECQGEPIPADQVNLPADFPQPGELTITEAVEAGPSLIIEGYWESDLEEAYEEWKRELEGAGYTILFDEIEEDDSEISYESADGTTTGQVALRADCGVEDRIAIHITNRPTG